MPSREYHNKRDKSMGRGDNDHVHALLDQFAHYPDMAFLSRHRKFLHHHEGVEYVRMRWGNEAAEAARQHIIDDCGHIPDAIDYYTGNVDQFGGKVR